MRRKHLETNLDSIRSQALKLNEKKKKLMEKEQEIDRELKKLDEYIRILDKKKELPKDLPSELSITESHPILIKVRIRGKILQLKNDLSKLKGEIMRIDDLISKLRICYKCGGTGYIVERIDYVRSDGIVTPNPIVKVCDVCKGKGVLDLGI